MTQKKIPVGFKLKFQKGYLSLLKTRVSHLNWCELMVLGPLGDEEAKD